MNTVSRYADTVASELELAPGQVRAVIELLEDNATIPFIARYRKERTGQMDEVQLRAVRDRYRACVALEERKAAIRASLDKQGKLSAELERSIASAASLSTLEDIYLPYRPKRETRADKAKQRGLEPFAGKLLTEYVADPAAAAADFLKAHAESETPESVLSGARDIIAEWISENAGVRGHLRASLRNDGRLRAQKAKKKRGSRTASETHPQPDSAQEVYRDYYDWSEAVTRVKPHRVHAVLRGEKEGVLSVAARPVEEAALRAAWRQLGALGLAARRSKAQDDELAEALRDSYTRLIAPSLETELKSELKERADEAAAAVFADNLRDLLMAPPLGLHRVMAIDPGYRTGCKVVCLDESGSLLASETIYPLEPHKKLEAAEEKIRALLEKHGSRYIAVGNGTGGREAEQWLRGLFGAESRVTVVAVSEAGASVYSASEVARAELPQQDVTVRGAVSIGRRLIDPLAELVKIPPESIGVGQYQHDVKPQLLAARLTDTVVSCVNAVGVELNTASPSLLSYVSGLSKKQAEAVVAQRGKRGPFQSREELSRVPGIGPKAFEQAAGFLRIRGGSEPLDATAIHPERYDLARRIAQDLGIEAGESAATTAPAAGTGGGSLLSRLNPADYSDEHTGEATVRDIVAELERPGRDPRPSYSDFAFREDVRDIEDLAVGMWLPGAVTNVTDFGAFVDVGVHRDGLVHISALADHYVESPRDILRVGQRVQVRVISVDLARKRIGLSMIDDA